MVVERRQLRAAERGRAAHPQGVAGQRQSGSHGVQLRHGGGPVGLLQAGVRDVLEDGLAVGEGRQRREDRQHVGHVPAVDRGSPQPHAVVAHAQSAAGLDLHRDAHVPGHAQEVGLGVVGRSAVQRGDAAQQDVGRVERGGGDGEGRGADVRRQGDVPRPSALSGLDGEAPPVLRHLHPQPELPHHRHGEFEVGALVQLALDLDDRRPLGERRQQDQPGDPLRERARDPHVAAGRPAGPDLYRRAAVGGGQVHTQLPQRVQQRAHRAPAEVLLAGHLDGPVREGRQADHEVERRAGAAGRHGRAPRPVDAAEAVHDERVALGRDPHAQAAQEFHGVRDVPRLGQAVDAAHPVGQGGQDQRTVRVVFRRRYPYVTGQPVRAAANEKMHDDKPSKERWTRCAIGGGRRDGEEEMRREARNSRVRRHRIDPETGFSIFSGSNSAINRGN